MALPMHPLPGRGDRDRILITRRGPSRAGFGGAAAPVGWRDTIAVWLPWIVAPVFVALPIGGCGMGERLRQAAARPIAAPAPGEGTKGGGPVTLVTFEPR
jgi:hypothetical protein